MPVVRIRHVPVRVAQRLVPMPMAVFCFGHRGMPVVVVPIVVAMGVLVFQRRVLVLVRV